VRAGFSPFAIDLFADRDLAALGPARRLDRSQFPDALEAALCDAPPGPWMYTGPLENHPELIERMARERPLWGIGGEAMRAVRDPFRVAEVLDRAGLPRPELRDRPDGLPRDGSWLVKPRHSAGGLGIRLLERSPGRRPGPGSGWHALRSAEGRGSGRKPRPSADLRACHPDSDCLSDGPEADGEATRGPVVYQRRISGPSFAALFLAGPTRCRWLGSTAQRLGRPGEPFAYAGSIGPVSVSPDVRSTLGRIGEALRSAFGLRGLFGVDYVLDDGAPWTVEINPRYTASVEVLELAHGRAYQAAHAGMFGCPIPRRGFPPLGLFIGKAVLFAEHPCQFPSKRAWRAADRTPFDWSALADVPHPGEPFAAGDPVVTVFARGDSREACEVALEQAVDCWRRRLVLACGVT
jgi:predicted ATP-grasp superfamily ATP-dependent carboligase